MKWMLCVATMACLFCLTGCYDSSVRDTAYERALHEDQKRRDASWAESDRMVVIEKDMQERSLKFLEREEALQPRWEALLKKQEEQAARFDSLLTKWEQMAVPTGK